MTPPEMAQAPNVPGRRLAVMGVLCAVLGVAAYAACLAARRLVMPWFLPASALLGAVMIAISLRRKRTLGRTIALGAVLLLAGVESMFLFATRLPSYTGQVAAGLPFPAFKTTRADGTAFTDRDLRGRQTTALVFFRGRW